MLFGIGLLAPKEVKAHDAYYLNITLNSYMGTFEGSVIKDNNGNGVEKHAEMKLSGTYYGSIGGKYNFVSNEEEEGGVKPGFSLPSIDGLDATEIKPLYTKSEKDEVKDKYVLPFTFPGRHGGKGTLGAVKNSKLRNADSADAQMASFVNETLVGGLNQALGEVISSAYSRSGGVSRNKIATAATKLANASAVASTRAGAGTTQTFTVGDATVTVSPAGDSAPATKYVKKEDFVKVKVVGKSGSSKEVIAPYSVSKGYGSGQKIRNKITGTSYAPYAKKDAAYLTWQMVVQQGIYNSFVIGVESDNSGKMANQDWITRSLVSVFDGLLWQIRSILGTSSIPDLMTNSGSYKVSTWKGIMPNELYRISVTVHLFIQFLAWFLLIGAGAKLLAMRNLSAVNPQMRVDFRDGIQSLIISALALPFAVPVISSIATLSEGLVSYFASISSYSDLYGNISLNSQNGTLGGIAIGLFMFIVEIYFNFFYIVRGLTVAVLIVLSPIAIVSVAFGGKYKTILSNFSKEIVGNIFIQPIHALMIALFSLFIAKGAVNGMMYTIILYISFIPITKLLKGKVFELGGDSTDKMASSMTGASVSSGVHMANGAGKNIRSGGGSGGGGEGGSGSGGLGGSISERGGSVRSSDSGESANLMDKPTPASSTGNSTAGGGSSGGTGGGMDSGGGFTAGPSPSGSGGSSSGNAGESLTPPRGSQSGGGNFSQLAGKAGKVAKDVAHKGGDAMLSANLHVADAAFDGETHLSGSIDRHRDEKRKQRERQQSEEKPIGRSLRHPTDPSKDGEWFD